MGVAKNVQRKELGRGSFAGLQIGRIAGFKTTADPFPRFFVSVAFKGVSLCVSLLFATLAGRSISVVAKGFRRTDCWREGNAPGFEDFEGAARTTGRAHIVTVARKRISPTTSFIITYRYS